MWVEPKLSLRSRCVSRSPEEDPKLVVRGRRRVGAVVAWWLLLLRGEGDPALS